MSIPYIDALRKEEQQASGGGAAPDGESEDRAGPGERLLRCASCEAAIADERDVFSLRADGPVGVFINPAGFFHDIVTLARVTGLLLSGPPVTRDSWFAGYSWTIAHCSACGLHLGWRFDALDGQSPLVFWALRRAALSEG